MGGLLALIEPLEAEGTLVRRSRERLEMEIDRFTVLEYDGLIIGCAALYPFPEEEAAELACMAVNKDYRGAGGARPCSNTCRSRRWARGSANFSC